MTGVLAVQGDFAEHINMLRKIGEECFEIRQSSDLDRDFDRLVFPGGESTVQSKLIRELDMYDRIKTAIESGMSVFATCAGLILLCDTIDGSEGFLRTIPADVKRNAYGRQLGSFAVDGEFKEVGRIPMRFIRAPYINSVADDVKIMSVTDGNITGIRYKNQLAVAFHPELCEDEKLYRYFLNM